MAISMLLTTNDLCSLFQVNRSTIHRWVRSGVIPKPKIYGMRSPRWTEEQIFKVIEAKEI
ncbi:MAG: transcriptional regulator [Parcubacteria group bacterium]|nr:transcriptional regulator [Parcubacteria group bacterium]